MAELKPCGTIAAARRHRRAGEEPCSPCQQAIRDEKNSRKDAQRTEAAKKAQTVAASLPDKTPHMVVLEEIQRTLRAQMLEAPPQSVAAIAKELRAVSSEIGSLSGESKQSTSSTSGGGMDDLARRREERQANRSAAASG